MKKIVILITCISAFILHGMDNSNSLSYQFGTTIVQLTKGCIYDVAEKGRIIVVGANEQWKLENEERELKSNNFFDERSLFVGHIIDTAGGTVKTKNKINSVLHYKDKYINSVLLMIREPLVNNDRGVFTYEVTRYNPQSQERFSHHYLKGTQAIQTAATDLGECYKSVLNHFCKHEDRPKEEIRTIAVPALSTDIGFPSVLGAHIATMEVVDFIHTKPYGYTLIHLFVKTDSEFETYKAIFDTHVIHSEKIAS